ncbi:MAG: phospholipid/cholesterol/gamma-HCH transport system ATP-binding protein, partial [Mycobacterium sp.]|nr:phospholipid/cholesterol/gamma-HCH transport system ATP-binding protein [Mycobacterium sp.]
MGCAKLSKDSYTHVNQLTLQRKTSQSYELTDAARQVGGDEQRSAGGFRMGIGIQVEGLTKSFGSQRIWEDVTLDIPPG